MDHLEAQALLNEYLDDALPADVRRAVAAHLGSCAECRAELADLTHLRKLLRSLVWEEVPQSFTIPAAPVRPAIPRWLRPVRYATAVAAVLLVTLFVGDLWNQPAQPAEQRTALSAATAVAGPIATPVGPVVAGAQETRSDPNQAPPWADSRPADNAATDRSAFRIAETALGLILVGLLAASIAGWWIQRTRTSPR